jgi:hypothetical protein
VEKWASSILTALATVFFYLTLRRLLSQRVSVGAALVFAFGTSMWATSSQMLWPQTAVSFALTVTLWSLTASPLSRRNVALAGFMLSLAVCARPTAAILFLAGIVSVVMAGGLRRETLVRVVIMGFAAAPLLLLTAGFTLYYYQSLSGGYGSDVSHSYTSRILSLEGVQGIAGLLASPNRGLLVYTPIALLGISGLLCYARRGARWVHIFVPFGIASLLHLLVVGTFLVWWGGWSFGPRYLVDIIPILALAGAVAWSRIGVHARRIALVAIIWGVLVQVNGVVCYPASKWDARMEGEQPYAAWSLKHIELYEDFESWRKGNRWVASY